MDGHLDPVKSNQCSRPRPKSIIYLPTIPSTGNQVLSQESRTRLECQDHLLVIFMRQLRGGQAFYSGDDYVGSSIIV